MTPAYPLPMDPRIQTLHDRLSELFEREGDLSGGDAISIVENWFKEIGKPLPSPDPTTNSPTTGKTLTTQPE